MLIEYFMYIKKGNKLMTFTRLFSFRYSYFNIVYKNKL